MRVIPKVIKSEAQYREYLDAIEELMGRDAELSVSEVEQLETFALLTEVYEKQRYEIPSPDPVDAILFRMEESNLRQKDLVSIIGSKSKVSEVLSGKRPLSLKMIRGLSEKLDIPATVLVKEPTLPSDIDPKIAREVEKRGWLDHLENGVSLKEKFEQFIAEFSGAGIGHSYLRRDVKYGGEVQGNNYALNAWIARVVVMSRSVVTSEFVQPTNPGSFLKDIAQYSRRPDGPLVVTEALKDAGVAVVIVKHLPKTKVDGVAVMDGARPVIGLSLRFDRLDYFWFTLLHELAHVLLHLRTPGEVFLDTLEMSSTNIDHEAEADRYAKEACVPRSLWVRSDAFRLQTKKSVNELANEMMISPSIIAGRIRFETGNFKKLTDLIGSGKVRKLFPQEFV